MERGVDLAMFNPAHRSRGNDGQFVIGYVGRLSTEKNVRSFAGLAKAVQAAGYDHVKFVFVGHGAEQEWLSKNIPNAEMTGVLRGEPLSRAYANMDLFAFYSETDTFGNVVLEALASGVPAVVTDKGGPKFIVDHERCGFVCSSEEEFNASALRLIASPSLQTRHGRRRPPARPARLLGRGLRLGLRRLPPPSPKPGGSREHRPISRNARFPRAPLAPPADAKAGLAGAHGRAKPTAPHLPTTGKYGPPSRRLLTPPGAPFKPSFGLGGDVDLPLAGAPAFSPPCRSCYNLPMAELGKTFLGIGLILMLLGAVLLALLAPRPALRTPARRLAMAQPQRPHPGLFPARHLHHSQPRPHADPLAPAQLPAIEIESGNKGFNFETLKPLQP